MIVLDRAMMYIVGIILIVGSIALAFYYSGFLYGFCFSTEYVIIYAVGALLVLYYKYKEGTKAGLILSLIIIISILISLWYVSGNCERRNYIEERSMREAILNKACSEMNSHSGCPNDPSEILMDYDANNDDEINQGDNFQVFMDYFYGCGGDPDCPKRICGCPGY